METGPKGLTQSVSQTYNILQIKLICKIILLQFYFMAARDRKEDIIEISFFLLESFLFFGLKIYRFIFGWIERFIQSFTHSLRFVIEIE